MRMINFIIIISYFCSGKNLYFCDVQRITVETINQLPNTKDKVAPFNFFIFAIFPSSIFKLTHHFDLAL